MDYFCVVGLWLPCAAILFPGITLSFAVLDHAYLFSPMTSVSKPENMTWGYLFIYLLIAYYYYLAVAVSVHSNLNFV